MDCCGLDAPRRMRPSDTRNWRTAPSHRATTSRIPLSAPASTRSFTPSRRNPVAVGVAVTMASNGDHDLPGSYAAQDATTSPDTKDSIVSSWFSAASTRPASTVLTGCSGPGATVLPASSATSARSWTPSPDTLPPPSSSGTRRLVQPSSAARRHQSASNEVPARVELAQPAQRCFLLEERLRRPRRRAGPLDSRRRSRQVRTSAGTSGLWTILFSILNRSIMLPNHDLSLSLFVEAL